MAEGDIMAIIRQIATERKIEVDEIVDAIKDAVKTGFKSAYGNEKMELIIVEMDPEKGHIAVYLEKKVVKKVAEEETEISLDEAKTSDPTVKLGDTLLVDITPEGDFGRIAAQTARQVILQKLRESEKESAIRDIEEKIGTIDNVSVQRILGDGSILCEMNRARAIMPREDRIPNEFYKIGSRIKVLLREIKEDTRGKYIEISRSAPDFLAELFRMEVPEIESGTVEIVSIAREAGSRSKVAVRSNSEGIDPIGSCVGQKGVRINAIMNELKIGMYEEKIDIILWDEEEERFLMNAIRPAEALKVELLSKKEKHVKMIVPNEQQALAIGKGGQNVRLAMNLTGWRIDIENEAGETVKHDEPVENGSKEKVGKSEEDVITTEAKAAEVTEENGGVEEVKEKKAKKKSTKKEK